MKPDGYPLPWCEAEDRAYWDINLDWCLGRSGWLKHQSGRQMADIIPEIDEILSNPGAQRSLR